LVRRIVLRSKNCRGDLVSDRAEFFAAATSARLGANGLALGRRVDVWSLALTVLALAGLLWAAQQAAALLPQACLLLSVLAGGMQKIFALRVAFDAAIFRDWAERWGRAAGASEGSPVSAIAAELLAFDRALSAIGLRAAPGDPLRGLDSRLRGAWRLLRWQLIALAAQFIALIVAVPAMHLPAAG
jgi:hypothetical protein